MIVLLLLLVSSVVSVDISLTSGELCEGAVATWTCVVDGVILGWRNLGETAFPSLSPNLVPLGSGSPFNSTVTSINGPIITSIATANLTSAVNGSLLECSDSTFSSSPTENVTLILKDSKAANVRTPVFFGDGIRVTWGGATCSSSYRFSVYLSVYEVDVQNVPGTIYMYDFTPETSGDYSFELTSVDYLGNNIGSINTTSIPWKEPKFFVDININNSIANFTFKNDDVERPPVTSCTITFDGVLKSCLMNNIVIFNITSGAKHSYNITITNAADTVNMNGELSNEVHNTTIQVGASIDPVVIAAPPAALGILIILIGFWMVLRTCWKRQCCCPRIWRSSFWLIFFCYDCCTYDAGVKEPNAIGLKNPNIGGEKGNDTPL